MRRRTARPTRPLLGAGVAAVLLAGCTGSSGSAEPADTTGDGVVEIMYGFTDSSSEEFQAEVSAFADAEGIRVRFAPTPDFNTAISTRISSGDPPDVAIFPQPGIMRGFARDLAPLDGVVDPADLEAMVPGIVEAGQVDGEQLALPVSLNVKSIVFYPRGPFEEAGYTAPTTLEELGRLTDTVRGSGTAPWCFGIESGSATGWPATDWVENVLLAQSGPEVYQQWVAHEIPFDDPAVLDAATTVGDLLLGDGDVAGGRGSIAGTSYTTAGNPLFDDPPGCLMYRQGNFVLRSGGFPDAVLDDVDARVGVFPVPGATAQDRPVLGGGDLAAVFRPSADRTDVAAIMGFLGSADFGRGWARADGFISPRRDFDPAGYPDDVTRQVADIAYSATSFVFDGSDQMPGEVGSGSFWREMTTWVSGEQDAQTALADVEASWPPS